MNKKDNVITLNVPIQRGETQITEIELIRPKAGQLRGISLVNLGQMDVGEITKLLPRISNPSLIDDEVNQLDLADLVEIGAVITSFFTTAPSPPALKA